MILSSGFPQGSGGNDAGEDTDSVTSGTHAAARTMTVAELRRLAASGSGKQCACVQSCLAAWTAVPASFPVDRMKAAGSLAVPGVDEPTWAEYHINGTHYWSPDAPIAMDYYPYNRCDVLQCLDCGRAFLAYAESGGYYLERRIRAVSFDCIVDAPPPL